MPFENDFCRRFELSLPVIQAPMAGGGDTPGLTAAVCEAGGLGFIGAAYLTPEQILQSAAEVRRRTRRPFGVNLFAPTPVAAPEVSPERAAARLAPYFAELGLDPPSPPAPVVSSFEAQLEAALETGASVFSFTFGIFPASAIAAIKERGMFLMGTATTVREAVALESAGADAVVAQGSESGGHRGTFAGDFAAGLIGTVSLVPQITDAVKVPVIASGGIMDGRGVVAALALGACAAQLGTAFLTCRESGIPEAYRNAILTAGEDQTRLTRAFSGRPARGIVNRFMQEMDAEPAGSAVLPFPLQNSLTRPLRAAAGKQGRAEFLSLWAGQGVRMARAQSAAEFMARLAGEISRAMERLNRQIA